MRINCLFQASLMKAPELATRRVSRRPATARRTLFLEALEQRELLATMWGMDRATLFSIDDYTQIGAGAGAAGLTLYGNLKYQNAASGSLANLSPRIEAFALDSDGIGYLAYNSPLTFTDGQSTLPLQFS